MEKILIDFSKAFVFTKDLETLQIYEQIFSFEKGRHEISGKSHDQLEILIAVKSNIKTNIGFKAITINNYPCISDIQLEENKWQFPIEKKYVFIFPKYHRIWFDITNNCELTLRIARLKNEYLNYFDKYQWSCIYHHECMWKYNAMRNDPTDMNLITYKNGMMDLSGYIYAPIGGNVALLCYIWGWNGINIKCFFRNDYFMLPNSKAISNAIFFFNAIIIQRMWRHVYSCPDYKLCRTRLMREYNESIIFLNQYNNI